MEGALKSATTALASAGVEGWFVGGAVRDGFLGRDTGDIDIAVPGDPERAARALAKELKGPVFKLSEEFGAWRAMDREREFVVDVSPLQGDSIEDDLGHRDFTVNAMAAPLRGGEVIDPHGGEKDLRAGVLRVLGARAYEDDPLRALRLPRLAAQLGMDPDEETERLTREAAPRLTESSAERVLSELRLLVSAADCVRGVELAARLGVFDAVLPELTALRGVEQSRFHHLDVYDHTLEVLRRLVEIERDPAQLYGELGDRVAGVLSEGLADDMTRGEALRFGALFHDVAKPDTRGERPDGRVTFVGHDSAGEAMVRSIFERLRASERLRSFVGRLTREHLALGFLVRDRPLSRLALHAYLRRCEPVEVEVTVLSCADRLATRGTDQEPWIEAHLGLARQVMEAALDWREHGPPGAPVRGDELAAELGLEPGPEIGPLLARIEAGVYAGEVSGREDALALARSLLQDRAP